MIDKLSPTNRRWVIFTLSCAVSFLLYIHRYTWNFIRPALEEEYGFSNTELGLLNTAFYVTYAIGQIPSGVICDLFGTQLFLVAIVLVWTMSLPLHGLGGGRMSSLIGARLVFGASQAGAYPALGQVTRTWFPASTRTQVQGVVASFFGRSGAAASSFVLATVLIGWCGLTWRVALFWMCIPGIVLAALIFLVFRSSPDEDPLTNDAERALIRGSDSTKPEVRAVIPFRQAWRNVTLRVMVFQQFLNAGADVVYTSMMGSFFLSLGTNMKESGWMVSLPLMGGAIGGTVAGLLNDAIIRRTGSRRWARSAVGFSGKLLAAVALLFAIQLPTAALVACGLFVVKFFTDWSQPTVWGTCTDVGGKYSSTVFSINNTAGNVGALVLPLVFGPLLDWFRVEKVIDGEVQFVTDFTPMFTLVGVMYVGAAVLWLFVDCTRRIEPE